jgi:hypothetical protein
MVLMSKNLKIFTAEKEIRNEYFFDKKLQFNYPKAYIKEV